MSKAETEFWASESRLAESAARLNTARRAFDVEARKEKGTSLSAAEMLEPDALRLFLVDRDQEALEYERVIGQLALQALETRSAKPYDDIRFAHFAAHRCLTLSHLILSGAAGSSAEECLLALEALGSQSGEQNEAEIVGRKMLFQALLERWQVIGQQRVQPSGSAWDSVIKIMKAGALAVVGSQAMDSALRGFALWFRSHADVVKYKNLHDPRFMANEIMVLAAIRYRIAMGSHDAVRGIKSIRRPELLG